MKFDIIYITTKDAKEARIIGKVLIDERLVACVNIIAGMESLYRWQGKLEHDTEAILIAKTRSALTKRVIGRVKELHSYACPCIVSFAIDQGNKEYLEWLEAETTGR